MNAILQELGIVYYLPQAVFQPGDDRPSNYPETYPGVGGLVYGASPRIRSRSVTAGTDLPAMWKVTPEVAGAYGLAL